MLNLIITSSLQNMIRRLEFLSVYTVIVVIFTCMFTLLASTAVREYAKKDKKQEITNDIVIEKVSEQAFLVTQTVYTDQETKINIDQGSAWSNFWWGRSVTAEGRVRTDIGIDFSDLEESDITIDENNKLIRIKNADPSVLDSSVTTDLEIKAGGSLLRKLLKTENNQDYKLASEKITAAAQRAVEDDKDLEDDSRAAAARILTQLFSDSGYRVEIE